MDNSRATVNPLEANTFDEESCRYFLREVGEQIVPFYPFAFGIDEVYAILLERYGEDTVADALSLLHELMEGDDNANGLGDDGDIWRSWRHSWRHRNDDPSNPFMPTVRDKVLPPPTPPNRRRARATDFHGQPAVKSRKQENPQSPASEGSILSSAVYKEALLPLVTSPAGSKDLTKFSDAIGKGHRKRQPSNLDTSSDSSSHLGDLACKPRRSTRCSHGDKGLSSSTDSDSETRDSQQEFEEVRPFSDLDNIDHSQLISFEMITPVSGLRGGVSEVRTFRPVRSRARSCESPLSVKHLKRISQSPSCQVFNLPLEQVCKLDQSEPNNFSGFSHHNDLFRATQAFSDRLKFDLGIAENPSTNLISNDDQNIPTSPCPATNSYLDTGDSVPPLTPGRLVSNRNARLIDGAIFNDKRSVCGSPSIDRANILHAGTAKHTVHSDAPAVRQKEPLRYSLIQGVRKIFGIDQKSHKQQQTRPETPQKIHKRHSSMLDNTFDRGCRTMLSNSRAMSPILDSSSTTRRQSQSFGLDGTADEVPDHPNSGPNLNKALPISPGNLNIRKPSPCAGKPSPDHTQDIGIQPSIASSVSSVGSTQSSRRACRGMTRVIINDDINTNKPDLSPVRETGFLPTSSSDPRKSMQSSVYSYHSDKNAIHGNLLVDESVPLTPGIPMPLYVRKNNTAVIASHRAHLPASKSSPDVQFFSNKRGSPQPPVRHSPAPARYDIDDGPIIFEPESSPRGRISSRSVSPTRRIRDPNTDPKARRRSRSPVKRFFGIGKSNSLKETSSQPGQSSNNISPGKDKTTPLRTWGSRFRHGFSTQDPDSIASLEDVVTPPEKGTPSTTPQSTFPISLDPPYQAKMLSELELMICITANRFLMDEFVAGRLSQESIVRTKRSWINKNRPQVLEFSYDQITQRELIESNINTVHFHGECAHNTKVLKTTLTDWKTLGNEVAVRTFCFGDSAVRKYMHDSYKILEMLGAPATTFFAFQNLQLKSLDKIKEKQRQRIARNKDQETPTKPPMGPRRNLTPSPLLGRKAKRSLGSVEKNPSPGFEQAYDAFENSRGGRLGKMMSMTHNHHG